MIQINYFFQDINRIIGKKKYRFLIILFLRTFWGIFIYRIERQGYLLFRKYYSIVRFPFIPIFSLFQSFSNIDIHYEADIKGGLLILHPSIGIVISGRAIIGKNMTLTGGNIIGFNKLSKEIEFHIGDNCNLGANSVIIGPVKIGNNISIGASACVTKNFETDFSILAGVPAKVIN